MTSPQLPRSRAVRAWIVLLVVLLAVNFYLVSQAT
jgi:hypothetical protein